MGKHIQIRNVDEDMHRKIKVRAAEKGISLSDYLKRIIEVEVSKPSWEEMRRRMEAMPRVELPVSPAEMVRQERDSR